MSRQSVFVLFVSFLAATLTTLPGLAGEGGGVDGFAGSAGPVTYLAVGGRVDFQFDVGALSTTGLTVSAPVSTSGAVLLPVSFELTPGPLMRLTTVDGRPTTVSPGVLRSTGWLSISADDGREVVATDVDVIHDPTAEFAFVVRDDGSGEELFRLVGVRHDAMPEYGFWSISGDLAVAGGLARLLGAPELVDVVLGRVTVTTTIELTETSDQVSQSAPEEWAEFSPADEPPLEGGGTICGTPGPDVIVGALPNVSNYASVGGIEAYSIGTTSCNIGDAELLWIANINQHPVIAQNMYRLKDARFEQIGQSWLKHGFTALQGGECASGNPNCTCTPSGTGARLGVGCSDPYGSGLNGSQSLLGPRWEVNAHTGDYPYPFSGGSGSGSIYKRLQVHISDLDPAQNGGGLYFAEGQYVTPDDAAAGNQNNNASYRQISITGSGTSFSASFSGMPPTQREQPAIRAWQDHDLTVVETDVQIPNEGLVILSQKTTDLGGGTWHYEYAVQNLNSDRSVRSFSVPFTPGASILNIGFHDVDYHSGDGIGGVTFDGTDWPAVVDNAANTVTWSTDDFATNPNANALRWGTLYNFRFDSNASPNVSTVVTLGLFKPGTPASVTATTTGPTGGLNMLDCNNNGVDDLIDIANGTSADCNGNNIPDECEALSLTALDLQVVASGLNRPVFVTSPPGDATRLFVVEQPGRIRIIDNGVLLPTPFLDIDALVGGGAFGTDERGLLGMAFHPNYATNGFFYVNYTNNADDTVVARYTVSANPNIADALSAATIMTIAQPQTNHNGGWLGFGPDGFLYIATGDGGSSDDTGAGHTVGTGNAQDITNNLLGKMLRIDVDGGTPFAIPPDNPFVGVAGDDEIWAYGLRNPWRNSFDRLSGHLYIGDVGEFAWEEVDFQPAASPGGENYGWRCMEGNSCTGNGGCTCSSPALTAPIHVYDHSCGTTGGLALTGGYVYRGCTIPDLNGTYFFADFACNNVWSFRYDGTTVTGFQLRNAELAPAEGGITSFGEDADGELYIVTQAGGIYKIIAAAVCGNGVIEPGEQCDPPDGVTCDANCQLIPIQCGDGILQPGEQCDDGNTIPGDGCDANCQLESNDQCVSALPIFEGTTAFDTTGATTDGPSHSGICQFDGQTYNDIWYVYDAPCSGTLTVSTCDQVNYDSDLVMYDGADCANLNVLACNDDGPGCTGFSSILTAPVVQGTSYLIRVGGWKSGDSGSGNITLTNTGSPCAVCGNGTVEPGEQCDPPDGVTCDANCQLVPGDYVQGGRLYDRWWADGGQTPPTTDHPLWAFRPDMTTNPAVGSATWRCKECHGWDYRGAAGQYGPGSPNHTGFPGVFGSTLTEAELITLLTEPPNNGGGAGVLNGHDYGSTSMTNAQINDLVAFVLGGSGVIDETPYIAPLSGAFNGNEVQGQTNYTSTGACASCHGSDGTQINFSGDCPNPEYVGTVAVLNPWELLHKIRFGQPGQPAMPIWELTGTIQGAADIGTFAQLNLPVECNPNETGCDQCTDGNSCNGAESCVAGLCQSGAPVNCDDGNGCTADTCDAVVGCQNTPVANGTACTTNPPAGPCEEATCQSAQCVVTPLVAGTLCAGNGVGPCSEADTCDGAGTCNNNDLPDGPNAACVDADVCNGNETCVAGVCQGGSPLACDDGNPCNGVEPCDSVAGCLPGVLANDCNGNLIEDACDLADCVGDPACDDCDGNGTLDSCDIAGGIPDANQNGIPDPCETGQPIPTVSQWGLVGMGLLLLSAGTIVFRRRRHATA